MAAAVPKELCYHHICPAPNSNRRVEGLVVLTLTQRSSAQAKECQQRDKQKRQ